MNGAFFTATRETTLGDMSLNSHYPKAVVRSLSDMSDLVIITQPDSLVLPQWATPDSVVVEPATEELDAYVLGENYETLAMELPNGRNVVLSKPVQGVNLVHVGDFSFSWSSVPGDRSRVYRAQSPIGGPDGEFLLVAVVTSRASESFYTDCLRTDTANHTFSYRVVTPRGTTQTITLP